MMLLEGNFIRFYVFFACCEVKIKNRSLIVQCKPTVGKNLCESIVVVVKKKRKLVSIIS